MFMPTFSEVCFLSTEYSILSSEWVSITVLCSLVMFSVFMPLPIVGISANTQLRAVGGDRDGQIRFEVKR